MNARQILGILIVLLAFAPTAMADGGYIPEVAYPTNPASIVLRGNIPR